LVAKRRGNRSLALRLLDPEGRPVPGALIDVERDADQERLAREHTDADGRLQLGDLPAGKVGITAQSSWYASAKLVIDLTRSDRDEEIRFGPESAILEVVRLDGTPARC